MLVTIAHVGNVGDCGRLLPLVTLLLLDVTVTVALPVVTPTRRLDPGNFTVVTLIYVWCRLIVPVDVLVTLVVLRLPFGGSRCGYGCIMPQPGFTFAYAHLRLLRLVLIYVDLIPGEPIRLVLRLLIATPRYVYHVG